MHQFSASEGAAAGTLTETASCAPEALTVSGCDELELDVTIPLTGTLVVIEIGVGAAVVLGPMAFADMGVSAGAVVDA